MGIPRGAIVMETRGSRLLTTTPSGPRGFRLARWWRAGGSVRHGTPRRRFRARPATQVRGRGAGEGPRGRVRPGFAQRRPGGRRWPRQVVRPRIPQDPRGALLSSGETLPGRAHFGQHFPWVNPPRSTLPLGRVLLQLPSVGVSPRRRASSAAVRAHLASSVPSNWFCFCAPPSCRRGLSKSDLNQLLPHAPTSTPVPSGLPPVADVSTYSTARAGHR